METKKCKRCGHEWNNRVEKPLSCPKCKNNKWDTEKTGGKNEQQNISGSDA